MSYSSELKEYLENIEIKKNCCRLSYEAGKGLEDVGYKCESDAYCYLLGLFVGYGTMTDPEKQYLVSFTGECADIAEDVLTECGLFPLRTRRKGKDVVYLRESVDELVRNLEITGISHRPLLAGSDDLCKSVQQLLSDRSGIYEKTADIIIDADGLEFDDVAAEIIETLG